MFDLSLAKYAHAREKYAQLASTQIGNRLPGAIVPQSLISLCNRRHERLTGWQVFAEHRFDGRKRSHLGHRVGTGGIGSLAKKSR
jgi:hypothetical protein